MKRLVFLFLFIFLLASGVNGAGLSLKVNTVDNLILVGEEAVFDVTIKNEQDIVDKVTFVISDLDWVWEKQFFDIAPWRSEKFQLKIKAPEGIIKPDKYSLNLKVYSILNDGVYVYEPLLITVLDETSFLKLEKIDYSVSGLDPNKEKNILKLIIKNRYDKPLNNVEIFLSSNIFSEADKKVDFGEAELKTIEFSVKLNSRASKGLHDVNVLLKKGNAVLLDEIKKVKVGEYFDIKEDKEVSFGFLIKRINVIRKNEGSVLSEQVYRLRLNSFERLFSDTKPKPSYVEKSGDDYYYVWNFGLKPGEEYKIYVEINYRDPLALLIVLIIIVYLIVYLTEYGISIKKKALTIKSKEGVTFMKILLLIKNKSKKEVKNVRVVDQLFGIKSVPSDYGTLRPSKVNRKGDDAILVWDNISLIGKEERILSYRVNVEIKNRIVLPKAMVRYKIGRRDIIVRSNSCFVVG